MKDNFLDSILFILVVAIAGLLFQLLSLHKDFKVYVDIFIQFQKQETIKPAIAKKEITLPIKQIHSQSRNAIH